MKHLVNGLLEFLFEIIAEPDFYEVHISHLFVFKRLRCKYSNPLPVCKWLVPTINLFLIEVK